MSTVSFTYVVAEALGYLTGLLDGPWQVLVPGYVKNHVKLAFIFTFFDWLRLSKLL